MAAITRANVLHKVEKPRQKEADAMIPPQQEEPAMNTNARAIRNDEDLTVTSSASKEQPVPFIWQTRMDGESRPSLEKLCQKAYPDDRIFKKILRHPKDHKSFEVKDGLIHYSTDEETRKLCIPHSEFRGRKLTKLVIDQVH